VTVRFDVKDPSCPNCQSTTGWMLIPGHLLHRFDCFSCGYNETFLVDEVANYPRLRDQDADDAEELEGAA
jgi:transposase-like protein